MKYGRIVSNVVQEIFIEQEDRLLEDVFHPDLCKFFQEVPDHVDNGFMLIDGVWTAPPEPEPEENPEPQA